MHRPNIFFRSLAKIDLICSSFVAEHKQWISKASFILTMLIYTSIFSWIFGYAVNGITGGKHYAAESMSFPIMTIMKGIGVILVFLGICAFAIYIVEPVCNWCSTQYIRAKKFEQNKDDVR